MKRRSRPLLAAACALALAFPAVAQKQPAVPLLNLEDALNLARSDQPRIEA